MVEYYLRSFVLGMVQILPICPYYWQGCTPISTFLVQGDLQDSSQFVQGADAQSQSNTSLPLVADFQTTTKAHTTALSGVCSDNRWFQKGIYRLCEWPVFQRQMDRKKGRNVYINILELETCVERASEVQG